MKENRKSVHIIAGGTVFHIRPHFQIAATAYGNTGLELGKLCRDYSDELAVTQHFTRMAEGRGVVLEKLETNDDVSRLLDKLIEDYTTKIIFMPVALCDWEAVCLNFAEGDPEMPGLHCEKRFGKDQPRLATRGLLTKASGQVLGPSLHLQPAAKIINKIRKNRKDIFLVGFKTTTGEAEQAQYSKGLNLLKEASCNLVFANDLHTQLNMVITPEEAKYHVTHDRMEAMRGLVEMAYLRSHLGFTRSTVVAGEPVPWNSPQVPAALREVVNYCIKQGAYKPFRGVTVGHFACKIGENTFLTSRRRTNFNNLDKLGLVKVETDGPDSVIAYGSRPSVGGQSQRIIFGEHPEYDCVVHAHVPPKQGVDLSAITVSQREYECGSHQCGENTSRGLKKFGNLSAVYLDQHGPNIVFHRDIDPKEVINFIETHFDLSAKTGGYVIENE